MINFLESFDEVDSSKFGLFGSRQCECSLMSLYS